MFLPLLRNVLLLSVIPLVRAEANEGGHLIPIRPNFDVGDVPHARTYARLCEERLFTESGWIIRYHGTGESAETGISITKRKDQKFLVTVKQAQPPLGSTIFFASDLKLDFKSALETIKIEEAHAEIPETVAMAVRDYWLSLLSDQRSNERGSSTFISKSVLLFVKSREGKILAGRLPTDASKYRRLKGVEDIMEDFLKLTVEKRKNDEAIFRRIEATARSLAVHRKKNGS
jgi:hypothetical protein